MEEKEVKGGTENPEVEATPKTKTKKKTIVLSTVFAIIAGLVGGFGGYVLYGVLNPIEDDIIVEYDDAIDYKKIEAAIDGGNVVDEYSDKAYQIINYSCDKYAKSAYSLTMGKGLVNAAAGVKQNIRSTTYNYPNGFFNQKVSSSSIVNTADRYYDDGTKIVGYECKKTSEWSSDTKSAEYTYDQYIQAFGKLGRGRYYCVDKTDATEDEIPEKFLTFDDAEYSACEDATKHERNAVIGYSVTKNSVTSSSIENNDNGGYHVYLELDIYKAVSFVTVQMKTTGRLSSRPRFSRCYLTFELDNKLNLVSSVFHDEYWVQTGIQTSASSDLDQIYLTSDTNKFVYEGKEVEVKVPTMDEVDFNGYTLQE